MIRRNNFSVSSSTNFRYYSIIRYPSSILQLNFEHTQIRLFYYSNYFQLNIIVVNCSLRNSLANGHSNITHHILLTNQINSLRELS